MENCSTIDFAELSEREMAAADRAETLQECQAHLERALRLASQACVARQRSPNFNVVEIRPGVRR